MKRSKAIGALLGVSLAAMSATAYAIPTNTETLFSVNGASVSATGIDTTTGLGTRTFTFNAAGSYDVRAYFDLDLSLGATGFSNEYGIAFNTGKMKAGQSWEIDEPGYIGGNIHDNFQNGGFDNTLGSNGLATELYPDDVAVGLGWNFTLTEGYKASLSFSASDTADSTLFYLGQFDAWEGNDPVYFYSDLKIEPIGDPSTVPEPSTFVLLGSALAGLAVYGKRRRNS